MKELSGIDFKKDFVNIFEIIPKKDQTHSP